MKLRITVHGVAYEVDVEILDPGEGFATASPIPHMEHSHSVPSPGAAPAPPPVPLKKSPVVAAAPQGALTSPIAGTVIEVKGKAGDAVKEGDVLLVIEAMKMNTSIAAPGTGKVKAIPVAAGDSVREGQVLVEFE